MRPLRCAPAANVIRREDRGDYVQEYLTFQTTPDLRVPAYVLIPKKAKLPAPGIVALHCHGGFYVWGKNKLVEVDNEHPALTEYKQELYQGKSIATELVRRGNVVIIVDALYWGERRMLLDEDPPSYRDPERMTKAEVADFNRRSQQNEQLVARSLFAAGITWPGVLLWDDLRTVDYLASRPEVDAQRLGCVGLSLGGYRSFLLAALDPRIKVAVDVGWMTSFASQIRRHVIHTIGFTFHIAGLYRYLDLPDLAALIAPTSAVGHQWRQRFALCTGGRARRLREDRRMLSQGGCRRPPALPVVRRTPRVQSSDAGRSICVDSTVARCMNRSFGVPPRQDSACARQPATNAHAWPEAR